MAETPREILGAITTLFGVTQGDVTGILRIMRALGNTDEKQREKIIKMVAGLVEGLAT